MSDFSIDFKRFADKSLKNTDKIIRESALTLTSAIIMDTPADTGRLKGNWQVTINTPTDTELSDTDKSGGTTIAKAQSDLDKPLGYAVWIQNNLPYVNRIEFEGWSKKSPQGMARRNIIKWDRIVDKFVRKYNS